jgi:hypothetical protein
VAHWRISGKPEIAVAALVEFLKSKDSSLRLNAAKTLGLFGADAKDVLIPLLDAVDDREERVRLWAVMDLGRIGPDAAKAVPRLIQVVEEEADKGVQGIAAVEALGRIGPASKGAVPILTKVLQRKHHNINWTAAKALGEIGADAKDAIPVLAEALRSDEDRVQENAAIALCKIGGDGVSVLLRALDDSSWRIQKAAVMALECRKQGKDDYKADIIQSGMSIERAEEILKANGAKEISLDSAPPPNLLVLHYSLPDNRLVSVVYDPQNGNRVTAINLCINAGADKKDLLWEGYRELVKIGRR